jgi:hypothetical protein
MYMRLISWIHPHGSETIRFKQEDGYFCLYCNLVLKMKICVTKKYFSFKELLPDDNAEITRLPITVESVSKICWTRPIFKDDSLILPRHLSLCDIYLWDILLWVLLLWDILL